MNSTRHVPAGPASEPEEARRNPALGQRHRCAQATQTFELQTSSSLSATLEASCFSDEMLSECLRESASPAALTGQFLPPSSMSSRRVPILLQRDENEPPQLLPSYSLSNLLYRRAQDLPLESLRCVARGNSREVRRRLLLTSPPGFFPNNSSPLEEKEATE